MSLRKVVPALAAIAVVSSSLYAADKDVVVISGWSDNIFYVGDDQFTRNDTTTMKDEAQPATSFYAQGSIKVGWTVAEKVHAKINLWVQPGATGNDAALNLRESYVTVDLDHGLSWTMGKYIDHLGWIAAEPTGLYRVNASNIGYNSFFYGNDVIGTALAFSSKDSPLSGSIHITNGYFTAADAANNAPGATATGGATGFQRNGTRENYDLGYGADLIYAIGSKGTNVNLEFADDPNGGASAAGGVGGNIFQVGLNATVKEVADLTLGAEVIYRNTSVTTQAGGGTLTGSHTHDLGYMALANYSIEKFFPVPASVSLSFQQYTTNWDNKDLKNADTTLSDYALALLTNPFKNTNFGLNAEISYITEQNHNGLPAGSNRDNTDEAWIGSIEAIAVIP